MKRKYIFFTALISVAMVSCKKDFLDINTNPNAATSAGPELVLPAALTNTAARLNPMSTTTNILGNAGVGVVMNGWMGYWAISGSYAISASDFTTYKQTTDFGDHVFQDAYHNLNDYNYVEQQAKVQTNYFFTAAAKIMKAYNFQVLVDLYNNVPYSEAFNGTTIIHPKYDDAKTIYEDLIKQCDTAVGLMKRSDATASATSDVLFGGNTAKWRRFGNTLKLRILMRQTQMAGRTAYIQAEMAKIVAEGSGFLGDGEDAGVNPGYLNSSGKQNPFYASNYNVSGTYINDLYRANQYSINFYKNNNDPRLTLVYAGTPSDATKYQGNSIGQISGLVGSNSSVFGPGVVKSFAQSAIIMLASESYFLQAEAVLRGYMTGNAQTLYQKGVTESFRYLGVPSYAAAATTYTTQGGNVNTDWSANANNSAQIALVIRQKWAAMNSITPKESYDDYRRLGLPADIPLSISPYVDQKAIPVRFLYPTSEYSNNAENVSGQGAINQHTSKVFWMP